MSRYYSALTLIEKETILTGAKSQPAPVDISQYADVFVTWVMEDPLGTGTFDTFGSPLPISDMRLADLDPDTNRFWVPVPLSLPNPDGILTHGQNNIGDNAIRSFLLRYTATTDTVGLSVVIGLAERG